MGEKAFYNDFAVFTYISSEPKMALSMPFDNSFGDNCKETITRNVNLMLQIEPRSRPSAETLIAEFSYNLELTQSPPPENVHIHRVFNEYPQLVESMRYESMVLMSSLQGNASKKSLSNGDRRP